MNEHIKLGEVNHLKVARVTKQGLYLQSGDENSVLLPNAYITEDMSIDKIIDVFIYNDSEDRMVATTMRPFAKKNEFGFFKVVSLSKFGAFVNWGLPKDLLVPKNKQKIPFEIGEYRIIRVVVNEERQSLIGDEKITSFLKKALQNEFEKNDEVNILLYAKTPMGFKVIVNNSYEGLIFHNEIHEILKVGDNKKAYIKNIRDDGKLDIILQKIGSKASEDEQYKILELLKNSGGFLPYNSKSDADAIAKIFGLSKKNFKATLTKLILEKKIISKEDGISLVN